MASTGARRRPQKYPDELRERAVRMVLEVRAADRREAWRGDPGRQGARDRAGVAAGLGEPGRDRLGSPAGDVDGGRAADRASSNARCASCAGRTTSSRPHRFSSRPSSTVDRRGSRLHRRPPGPRVRWAAMGGRADLPARWRSPPPPTGRPRPGRRRPERGRDAELDPVAGGAVGEELLGLRAPQADQGRPQGRPRRRP